VVPWPERDELVLLIGWRDTGRGDDKKIVQVRRGGGREKERVVPNKRSPETPLSLCQMIITNYRSRMLHEALFCGPLGACASGVGAFDVAPIIGCLQQYRQLISGCREVL